MHHRHVALAAEFQHFCPQVATQIIPPAVIVSSPTAPHTARLLIAARATVVVVVDAGRRATVLRINRRAGTVAQRWTTAHHRSGRTRSYLSTSPSHWCAAAAANAALPRLRLAAGRARRCRRQVSWRRRTRRVADFDLPLTLWSTR